MTQKTIESICHSVEDGGFTDPATIIEEFGEVAEILNPLLDTLVRKLPKPFPGTYDSDKTEALIRRFYTNRYFKHGEKLLEWFFFMEDERAVRLAIELSKSGGWQTRFLGISRLVFKWLRKKNAPWYWSIPEFREYLTRHLVCNMDGENSLPLYLTGDYDAGWATFQRAAREIIVQRDISMESVVSEVRELLAAGDIPAVASSEDVRKILQAEERSWFMEGIKHTLSMWTKKPRKPIISLDGFYIRFVTSNPDGDIAIGEQCTLIVHVLHQLYEEWDELKGCVVPRLKLEGVQTVTGEDISPIPWNAFKAFGERRGGRWQDREFRIDLRLVSPVGRIHLSFQGDGQEVRHDAGYYIGEVPKCFNAVWLTREK